MATFHLIIDADPLVYRCGFAAETCSYELVVADGNKLKQLSFVDGDDLRAWKKANKESETPLTVEGQTKLVTPKPRNFAWQIAGTTLRSIIADCEAHMGTAASVLLLLSGARNFRDDIATVKPYKGNRDEAAKPHWYQAVRNYMTDNWSAKVIDGREADDEVSILAARYRTDGEAFMVATVDKDLDQVPGQHYDYVKKVFYEVDAEDGKALFWKQCLSGDSTDNIPGATRVGAKAAARLVDEWVAAGMDDQAIWAAIVEVYADSKRHKQCPYNGLSPETVALEMARLVFMQEQAGQLWVPPGEPEQWLEVELDD